MDSVVERNVWRRPLDGVRAELDLPALDRSERPSLALFITAPLTDPAGSAGEMPPRGCPAVGA